MACPPMRQILSSLVCLSALILGQATYAGTALPLYEAQYRTKVSGISITLTRSLTEEKVTTIWSNLVKPFSLN